MITLTEKVESLDLIQQNKQITEMDYSWITVIEKPTRDERFVKREYSVNPMELSNWIKNNINYMFVRGAANEGVLTYIYMNGYYKCISDNELKGFIKSFIPYQLRKSREINEVYIDLTTEMKFINYDLLNSNEDIINFEDGLLNIRTMELLPHSPKVLSTIQIPAKYNEIKNASMVAPIFDNYMLTLCNGDVKVYDLLMQCLGLAISNIYAYRTKKALFLVGQGNTGKSQLKRIAEYLIGNDNVSSIDLKNLGERFGPASLYQKRLVGCNDMSYQRIEDMSLFKQLTGGDSIQIEFKNKNPFNYLYKGFLWFNCNKLPLFGGDTGKWVYDRIMPVYCNNVIEKDKQDPLLFEKMLKEKNSILLGALLALQKLIQNNFHFIEPQSMENSRKEYEVENNTLLTFIKECCIIKPDIIPSLRTKRSTFRTAYDLWIKKNNNGRGKLSSKDMNLLLEKNYGETYVKSDGIVYMSIIVLTPEVKEELSIYESY